MSKFLKRLWFTFSGLIIAIAIVFSLFRALTPWIKQYKTAVEHHLTTLIGAPVTIDTMKTGWYWFKPVIKLKEVKIWDKNKAGLELDRLFVGINMLQSLWHWQIQPGILYIDKVHLTLRKKVEGWEVNGLPSLYQPKAQEQPINQGIESYRPLLNWVLNQQKIIIHQLSCDIFSEKGKPLSFRDLNITMTRSLAHYRVKGKVTLAQEVPTELEWFATLNVNPDNIRAISGQAYLSAQHVQPGQWQEMLPFPLDYQLLDGKGNLQVWTEWTQGRLKNLQSDLNFENLAWTHKNKQKNKTPRNVQSISALKANVAWKAMQSGWEFSADHFDLTLNNMTWPQNSFLVSYQEENQTYFAYAQHLLMDSLSSLDISWPGVVEKVFSLKPKGTLQDTRVQVKDRVVDYLLTHFSGLVWNSTENIPGVQNLSGTLRWQPTEGRLEVDGEDTSFQPMGSMPIKFSMINAGLDWKILTNGLRVSLGRFVLTHPSFLLSAQGVADELTSQSMGPLRLNVNFSGDNVHQWFKYLPSKYLKPGLEAWLKNEIKEINKVDGEMTINGDMKNFPFDQGPGEFLIKSYLRGTKLIMAPKWPLVTDLEGYLTINKRNLEAKMTHANLGKVVLKEGNLRVDDIGHDKETLLVHAKSETEGVNALSYISSSPLNDKLTALQALNIQGPLAIDLKLEVPLFGENEAVLVLGDLNIEKDTLSMPSLSSEIQLNDLSGAIKFNQNGILGGELEGVLLKNPIHFSMKSISQPSSLTEVSFNSAFDASILSQQIQLPITSVLQGVFPWSGTLSLPSDEKAPLHLAFKSDLLGLNVNLPYPLGKSADKKSPASLNIDLKTKGPIKLNFNYNDLVAGAIRLGKEKKGGFKFRQGEIRLGDISSPPHPTEKTGLQIYGKFPSFNFSQWEVLKNKFQSLQTESTKGGEEWKAIINRVEFSFERIKILNESYKNLSIKVKKAEAGAWGIELNEEKLKANLYYQPATNTLTGIFNRLKLSGFNSGEKWSGELKPLDIPNLELKIESFEVNSVNLGALVLQTKSLPDQVQVHDLRISSPFYQFLAKGKWKKSANINSTVLETDLSIHNLTKMLMSWNVNPIVKATKGFISFQGSWEGPFYAFALEKLKGQMSVQFKNGRITNLSSSTQEKLGFGKLLSILSLQTIPRRLQLDFSDLSEEGYSFDRFNGSFKLHDGVLTTQDSDMDGPVAYTSIKGSVDLIKQLFDLDLGVYPHITASLPVVATIAGGPIAGIATWAASKIIDEGMQRITGYTYQVSGPWNQPVIQQVKIFKRR